MISWDDLFMSMAYLVAMKSKDEKTHIGAVIVGENNEVRSVGYNSFVRGLKDDKIERQERPEKYYWMEHAERNAIYNATLMGVSLKGCRMYTNGVPCMDCARAVIQSGIKEVIVDKIWNDGNSEKWKEHTNRAEEMFREVGVTVRYYEGKTLEISKWRNSKEYPSEETFIINDIDVLKLKIKNSKDIIGFDDSKLKEIIERLEKSNENKIYDDIKSYFFDVEQEFINIQFQSVLVEISKSRTVFMDAKKLGIDLSGEVILLNESRELLKNGKYIKAYTNAKETKKNLEKKIEGFKNES